jgi:hypothetical protein
MRLSITKTFLLQHLSFTDTQSVPQKQGLETPREYIPMLHPTIGMPPIGYPSTLSKGNLLDGPDQSKALFINYVLSHPFLRIYISLLSF